MNKNTILILSLIIMVFTSVSAEVKFGLKLGVGYAAFTEPHFVNTENDQSSRMGLIAGNYLAFSLNEKMSLQIEGLISSKFIDQKSIIGNVLLHPEDALVDITTRYSFDFVTIHVPVVLKFSSTRVSYFFGPGIGFTTSISGSREETFDYHESGESRTTYTAFDDLSASFKKTTFDLHAGIDFYLSSVFFVEIRAIIGLQSMEYYVNENTIIDSDDIFDNNEGPYGKKTYLFTYSGTEKVDGRMELRSLYFMIGTRY